MNHVLSVHTLGLPLSSQRRLGRYERPGTMVGNTPVLRISAPFTSGERGFWAKLEGFNPGGMKDRPAIHMVERGRASGDLRPGSRIVESTSGTLGLGFGSGWHGVWAPGHVWSPTQAWSPSSSGCCQRTAAEVELVDQNHTPKAGGSRPDATVSRRSSPLTRMRGTPTSTTIPTTSTLTARWRWNCRLSLVTSMHWCARWALGGILPGWRECCAESNPELRLIRRGHDRIDDLRSARRQASDARAGVEHLSGERRLRGVQ